MKYQSTTVSDCLAKLNNQFFLPAIQREFVWTPDQIIQLFDSLMRGYPISTFLFWELRSENRDKWTVYRFVERFKEGGTHNLPATTDGIKQMSLVLDGQQRLTALLIGLKGSYMTRRKHKRKDNPDAWFTQRLFLNLFKDPNVDRSHDQDGNELGVRYGFEFREEEPTNQPGELWFRVGKILDWDGEDPFERALEEKEAELPPHVTKGEIMTFRRNLRRLYKTVWQDDFISFYTEHEQDYDRVLDIFVRANEGGTKLSKSDLLLSMFTSKWDGVNARDEIYGFVDEMNEGLQRQNNFSKDFIMKSCLVLTNLDVTYKVENFSNKNLDIIKKSWPDIKSAIRKTVELVNSFDIDGAKITSANALIPIAYYFIKHSNATFLGTTPFDVSGATIIRRWITMCLLNGVFGGQSDGILTSTRKVLQQNEAIREFPAEELNAELARLKRNAFFNDLAVDSFLANKWLGRHTSLALSLLYDENFWSRSAFHQDHIFPRSLFSEEHLRTSSLTADQQIRFMAKKDSIGNLQLLLTEENLSKSAASIEEWLKTRDNTFKKKHLIPDKQHLLRFERFEEFLEERESLIRRRLYDLFPIGR